MQHTIAIIATIFIRIIIFLFYSCNSYFVLLLYFRFIFFYPLFHTVSTSIIRLSKIPSSLIAGSSVFFVFRLFFFHNQTATSNLFHRRSNWNINELNYKMQSSWWFCTLTTATSSATKTINFLQSFTFLNLFYSSALAGITVLKTNPIVFDPLESNRRIALFFTILLTIDETIEKKNLIRVKNNSHCLHTNIVNDQTI